jgi:hypothetical protein
MPPVTQTVAPPAVVRHARGRPSNPWFTKRIGPRKDGGDKATMPPVKRIEAQVPLVHIGLLPVHGTAAIHVPFMQTVGALRSQRGAALARHATHLPD